MQTYLTTDSFSFCVIFGYLLGFGDMCYVFIYKAEVTCYETAACMYVLLYWWTPSLYILKGTLLSIINFSCTPLITLFIRSAVKLLSAFVASSLEKYLSKRQFKKPILIYCINAHGCKQKFCSFSSHLPVFQASRSCIILKHQAFAFSTCNMCIVVICVI